MSASIELLSPVIDCGILTGYRVMLRNGTMQKEQVASADSIIQLTDKGVLLIHGEVIKGVLCVEKSILNKEPVKETYELIVKNGEADDEKIISIKDKNGTEKETSLFDAWKLGVNGQLSNAESFIKRSSSEKMLVYA